MDSDILLDAMRYRFIRDNYATVNGMGWFLSSSYIGGVGVPEREGSFDAAVDRAVFSKKGVINEPISG
jgi:hypothetical protein